MNDSSLPVAVFDASSLIAFVQEERGADRVGTVLRQGALISAVNWAEVLSDMAERGDLVDISVPRVRTAVARAGTLTIVPFDEDHALETARLRMRTKSLGLSLGDRACLALGRLHRLPVLTTDRAWRSLHLSIKIEVIR